MKDKGLLLDQLTASVSLNLAPLNPLKRCLCMSLLPCVTSVQDQITDWVWMWEDFLLGRAWL